MNNLTSDSRLPLYQRLRDQLAQEIANNRWRPGEAIPTEIMLANEYQLSMGTVRKAIDMLVAQAVLERQQGRGTFVRRPQFESSLFRFFRFQTAAGERRIPESDILSIKVMEATSAVADALCLAADSRQVIQIQRLRLLEKTPVLFEEIWLPYASFSALLDIDLQQRGALLYPLYEEVCGQVIACADESLTAEAISDAHAPLLQLPVSSPIVVIERLARDYAGRPLEWRRSRGHAGHFRYNVTIR